jgi:hypothetical protein
MIHYKGKTLSVYFHLFFTLVFGSVLFAGCAAIGDIFKAGFVVGIVIVVVIIALIFGVARMFRK